MLGHSGLADAEFAGDDIDNGAGGVLFGRQQLKDAAAHGVAEDVERVHQAPAGGPSPV